MRTLFIDIELSPNVAHVWELWNQNVGLSQLQESAEMLCFAAKWRGAKKTEFWSVHHHGKQRMVERAHELLSEADVVVGYNSRAFDVKYLHSEFLLLGMQPPAPFEQVDLLEAVKKRFRFPSRSLSYVAGVLGLGSKEPHEGHMLWVRCLAGESSAWARMKRYNVRDVVLTEALYDKLQPWIPGHPTRALYDDIAEAACPLCGSVNLVRQGHTYTALSKFQRYQCGDCGKWSRSGQRAASVDVREAV